MIKSIQRIIHKIGPVTLKLLLMIHDPIKPGEIPKFRKRPFRRFIQTYTNMESITYDFTSLLILDFNYPNEFGKERLFTIFICQIWKLVQALEDGLHILERDDIFYIDETTRQKKMYKDALSHYVTKNGFPGDRRILVQPTLLVDSEERIIEGMRICVDNINNFFEMTEDDLRSLIYILTHTDFISLGQTMVSSSLLWASKTMITDLGLESFTDKEMNTGFKFKDKDDPYLKDLNKGFVQKVPKPF